MAQHIINIQQGANSIITHEGSFAAYLSNIRKYNVMDKETEKKLLLEYTTTDDEERKIEIRNLLLTANQRFVISAAKQFANRNLELLMELIGVANLGFIEALEKFDMSKFKQDGKLFSWAAWYVRREINEFIRNYGSLIRPTNSSLTHYKMARIKAELTQKLEREPTEDEIIEYLSMDEKNTVKDSNDVLKIRVNSINICEDEEERNDTLYAFNDATANMSNVENTVNNDYNKELIKRGFSALTEKEQEIISMLYGLNDDNDIPASVDTVAEKFEYTHERIRQIHVKALKKMASKISLTNARL